MVSLIRPRFLVALSVIALFLAPAAVGWLIYRYGVNVPFSDQFEVGRFLLRNHGRAFPPWSDLFALHNESRMIFPRIVFFYLARLSGWNVKWEMAFSLLMACGTVALIGYLLRLHLDRLTALAAAAVAALLVFSPVQWWDWLVGFQMVMFFPPLLLAVALSSLARGRVLPAAAAAAVATFSFANGLFLWGALFPALLVLDLGRRRSLVIAGWIGVAAVCAGLYFHGYERPPGHPEMVLPHQAPLAFAAYMLAFLGHPVAWNQKVMVSIAVGAVLVCVLLACTVTAWRERRRGAATWAAFALYAGMSAGAAAAGRLKMSLAQALEPRYATIAIYMALGTIMMIFVLGRPRLAGIAVALLVAAHLLAVRSEWPAMELFHRERLTGRAAVDFALVAPDQTALGGLVWPDVRIMRRLIGDLASIGYAAPLRSSKIQAIDAGAPPWFGDFIGIAPLPQAYGAYGWASLPGPRPADAVLITREAPDGDEVIAVARHAWIQRPALGQIEPALFTAGWQHELRADLPPGTKLGAWAYDVRERRAYRIAGRFSVSGRNAVRY